MDIIISIALLIFSIFFTVGAFVLTVIDDKKRIKWLG